ncbi:CoA pyrophosphatase [Paraglaciecola sp. 20A4]|uniref:CoA pyrophosphatase n=1 Tax=Paraglaciecola sp. 20A4 TaxID=2687288 RepID=UPI00140BD692|nr:CoA pyrophosphatase [Paraglaciecola sp. 20A4]
MTKNEFLSRFHHARTIPIEPDYPLHSAGKPAAVLMPMIERRGQLSMLFTLRSRHLKHHAGQVSFPGGKQEPSDNNLLSTALRETHEEIGVHPQCIEVIGNLPLYRTVSRYEVVPYVGFVQMPLELTLDTNEVESVFEVPLNFLLDKNNHFIHWVTRKNAQQHPVYFIKWHDQVIWGATAAFVRVLSNHIASDAYSSENTIF